MELQRQTRSLLLLPNLKLYPLRPCELDFLLIVINYLLNKYIDDLKNNWLASYIDIYWETFMLEIRLFWIIIINTFMNMYMSDYIVVDVSVLHKTTGRNVLIYWNYMFCPTCDRIKCLNYIYMLSICHIKCVFCSCLYKLLYIFLMKL